MSRLLVVGQDDLQRRRAVDPAQPLPGRSAAHPRLLRLAGLGPAIAALS